MAFTLIFPPSRRSKSTSQIYLPMHIPKQYYYFHNLAVDEEEKASHHAYDNGANTVLFFFESHNN